MKGDFLLIHLMRITLAISKIGKAKKIKIRSIYIDEFVELLKTLMDIIDNNEPKKYDPPSPM